MKARVLSMGGTTLDMIMPSTVAISRPAGENRLCSRMPHSSAVCSWTVRRRHWKTSLRPSKAPIVMLLLPASRASSTYTSCKNKGIGSVVFPHHQEAGGIQSRGGSGDDAAGLVDRNAPSHGIAGGMREEAQNGFLVFTGKAVDRVQEGDQDGGGVGIAAGVELERGRLGDELG